MYLYTPSKQAPRHGPQKQKRKGTVRGEMTFLQHLEELRWHIIRALVAVVAGAILAFVFKNIIFDKIILAPNNPDFITNRLLCRLADAVHVPVLCINQDPVELISIKMSGQFTTHINISLVAGLILAFPYVFWEFWSFFRPALYEKERKYARGAVSMASFCSLPVFSSVTSSSPRSQSTSSGHTVSVTWSQTRSTSHPISVP
jgi:Sec-independent protein secretion pathway component TatC